MRQGWEIKKLGEILKIQNGYAFNSKQFTSDSGVPLIRIRDIKYGVGTETNFNGAYDQKYEVKAGDLLIGMDGEFGCYEWKGGIALLNQRVCRLQEFSNRIYSRFLFYGINKYLKAIEDVTAFATVKHISSKQIENIQIPLPPLPEQKRIVSILDEAFATIGKAKVNAEQNLNNAKELFESYLKSVFENKGEGWEQKTLGDVCSLYQGIAINAKTKHALVEKSDLPLLRIKDLKNNSVEQYIDPNNYPVNALVNESDIIYTRTGSLGLVFRGKRGVLHNNSFKVVPIKQLSKDYLFIWLQNPIFKSKILGLALKAAQPDITHAIFKIQEIAVPPIETQKTIVRDLDALSNETKKLEAIYQQKINNLEELKKSLLQKAFSGELKTTKVNAV